MFGATWSNSQQNQQQPPQTGAFGQPSAFGSTPNNAFGTTSAFGQPQQQQQQPQVNPMFGSMTPAQSTNTATSGFGGFGGATNNASTSAFGAKPAGGFGAFGGGTSAFGGAGGAGTTSAFGQPANNAAPAPSVFGQPSTSTTTSAFGGGNSLFGNKSTFGTTALTGTTGGAIPVVTTGSANPPYNITTEKDGTVTLQFQSMSCMPAYIGYSFEELRVQDYNQGRKTASTAGTFGGSAFGAAQPAATNVFGAQPAQQPTTSLFGSTANPAPTNNAFGTFGQANPQPAATTTNSLFGGTTFGQTQQQPQQQQSAFGGTSAFGQPQQPQQQTSLFGGGATNSAFGNAAPKPAFGAFGAPAATNTFGTTPSAFGNTQQQQAQPTQTTGVFGSTPAPNTNAFGNFGNTAVKPSIFGAPAAAQPAANNAFGGTFGGAQQQQQPQQQTSLFGNTTGNSLFGNTQQQQGQQQQGAQPNSLFGGAQQNPAPSPFGNPANTGGSLFGNPQQNQQQQQNPQQNTNPFGNLFGPKPAQPTGPSLFGGQPQTQQQQPQQQSTLFGNSFGQSTQNNPLFGSKSAAPLLGNSLSGGTGMNTTLFGASMNNGGAQGTLTASIAQPIGENLPIFSMLPPGPRIVDLEQNIPKKKAGFFLDMPTRSPVPRVQLGFTPANSKLRGFGSSSSMMSSAIGTNGSMSFSTGKPGALTLNKSDARASSVGPDFLGRSGSPALGSGSRQSVKKVILDKKVEPSELFIKSGSPGGLKTSKVTFSPALSMASREKDGQLAAAPPQVLESPTPVARAQQQRTSHNFGTKSTKSAAAESNDDSSSTELGEGDYWVKPDLPTLKKAGYDQLSSFEGLVVGRKGYGEIRFLEPVDLTGLPKLGALLGDVIKFDDKECSVYPDSEDVDKPPPGSGLNVKATLSLERCWAMDKATRDPITDPSHPQAVKHLKKLKNMRDTHFESFDMKTGTWTFTVDHF